MSKVFEMVGSILVWVALGANLAMVWKLRKANKELKEHTAEMKRYQRDRAPMLVDALEQLACAVCPFCAVAAGKLGALNEDTHETLHVEAEAGGVHVVDGKGNVPCPAAKMRADARKIINEDFIIEKVDFKIEAA